MIGREPFQLRPWLTRHETKARFVVAGGINTVFGLAIYPALYLTVGRQGMHYMGVLVISQVLSISFAYGTQKFLVFRTRGNFLSEIGKFSMFYLSYFVVNLVTLPFLVEIVHIGPIVAQFLISLAVIVTSYFWHSRITFRRREPLP